MKLFALLFVTCFVPAAVAATAEPKGELKGSVVWPPQEQADDGAKAPARALTTDMFDGMFDDMFDAMSSFWAEIWEMLPSLTDPNDVFGWDEEGEEDREVVLSSSSSIPSDVPSMVPVSSTVPSDAPSSSPSSTPVPPPTTAPIIMASDMPSLVPNADPVTSSPTTVRALALPSDIPSLLPSDIPSLLPSDVPSLLPSDIPSLLPSDIPSLLPSDIPSMMPSDVPSMLPSDVPSATPSDYPSLTPVAWEDPGEDSMEGIYYCPNTGSNIGGDDATTMEVFYAYRLSLEEEDQSILPVTNAIEEHLQLYLSTGDNGDDNDESTTICGDGTDEYTDHAVVGVTGLPLDVPTSFCGAFDDETPGDGPCLFVSGKTNVLVSNDVSGDEVTESAIYCRTLDLIRRFLDSGVVEDELPQVAEVKSTILGTLLPDLCRVSEADGTTIEMDRDVIFGDEGGADNADDEDDEADVSADGDESNPILTASESESTNSDDVAGIPAAYFIAMMVALGAGLAAVLLVVIHKRRQRHRRQEVASDDEDEEERILMDDGMGSEEEDDDSRSRDEQGSNAEAWPATPTTGVGSMSEVDGASQCMTPTSSDAPGYMTDIQVQSMSGDTEDEDSEAQFLQEEDKNPDWDTSLRPYVP